MLAFGGAAGLHATSVADEIGIGRIVFPESAGTLSAYGILHSNLTHDFVRSGVHAARPESTTVMTTVRTCSDERHRCASRASPARQSKSRIVA